MGLMDILNGMQNGPRGQQQQAPAGSGGGMSPMTMALLGLLAYKAIKGGGLGNILGGGGGSCRAQHRPAVHPTRAPQPRRPPEGWVTSWAVCLVEVHRLAVHPIRARQPRLHPAGWATCWAA